MPKSNIFFEIIGEILVKFRLTLFIFLSICGSFSIISLVEAGGYESLSNFILYCLERYRYLADKIFGFVDDWLLFIVHLIRDLFDIRIPVSEYWVDMFALMVLYMSTHARDAWRGSDRKWIATPFRFFWGVLVAFVVCIFSVWLPAAGQSPLLSASAACFFGAIGYRIGFSAQMAYDLAKREVPTPFIDTFLSKMKDSWILIFPLLILICLFFIDDLMDYGIFSKGVEFFVFFFVLWYCAFFHLFLSFRKYIEELYKNLLDDFKNRSLARYRAIFGVFVYFWKRSGIKQ